MSKIEFQMKPTLADFSKAAIPKMWSMTWFRIYIILFGGIMAFGIIGANYGPEKLTDLFGGVAFFACVAIMFPIIGVKGIAHRSFKQRTFPVEGVIFEVSEHGLGWNSEYGNASISWAYINKIYETKDFIFVRLRSGYMTPIFKNCIVGVSVKEIRRFFLDAPVKKKKMINNDTKQKRKS